MFDFLGSIFNHFQSFRSIPAGDVNFMVGVGEIIPLQFQGAANGGYFDNIMVRFDLQTPTQEGEEVKSEGITNSLLSTSFHSQTQKGHFLLKSYGPLKRGHIRNINKLISRPITVVMCKGDCRENCLMSLHPRPHPCR